MKSLDKTLNERGNQYGPFKDVAETAQELKNLLTNDGMDAVERECIEMIASKLARIVNGNPHYRDNWHDIAGYATLAEDHIKVTYEPATAT